MHQTMRRSRQVPGWVQAVGFGAAMFAAAWVGYHGGPAALPGMAWEALKVACCVSLGVCVVLVGALVLLAVVVWMIRLAEEGQQ